MKTLAVLGLVAMALTGCANNERQYALTCQSQGYGIGSREYIICVERLKTGEKQAQAKAWSDAADIWAQSRAQQPQAQYQPAPAFNQPVVCQRNGSWQVVCR